MSVIIFFSKVLFDVGFSMFKLQDARMVYLVQNHNFKRSYKSYNLSIDYRCRFKKNISVSVAVSVSIFSEMSFQIAGD